MGRLSAEVFVLKKLNEAYSKAKEINPRFSLRALAMKTNISASYLNRIFNGKRELTRATADKILRALNVSTFERKQIILEIPVAKNKRIHEDVQQGELDYLVLSEDEVILSNRFHCMALAELIRTSDFREDYNWISKKLDITVEEVRSYIEILLKVGLINRNEIGNLYTVNDLVASNEIIANDDSANNLIDLLTYFQKLLEEHKVDPTPTKRNRKTFQYSTYRVDTKKMDQVYDLIALFKKDLSSIVESSSECDDVYYLNINFAPATMKITDDGEKL